MCQLSAQPEVLLLRELTRHRMASVALRPESPRLGVRLGWKAQASLTPLGTSMQVSLPCLVFSPAPGLSFFLCINTTVFTHPVHDTQSQWELAVTATSHMNGYRLSCPLVALEASPPEAPCSTSLVSLVAALCWPPPDPFLFRFWKYTRTLTGSFKIAVRKT